MTKEETRAAIKETIQQIAALEAKHPEQEMRPWCANDHPIALEHWGLVQRRITLQRQMKKPTRSAEHLTAMARGKRESGTAPLFPSYQIEEKPLSGPRVPLL